MVNNRKLKIAICNSLDSLLRFNKKIAKAYNKQSIPLTVLKETIKQGYFKAPEGAQKEIEELGKIFNNLLDRVYDICEKAAKRMNAQEIPFSMLEDCILIAKKTFKKGVDE